MPPEPFWRIDVTGALIAFCLFPLVSVLPGYVAARLTNLFDFSGLPLSWRLVISVPVSIGIVPILAYWLDRIAGWAGVWTALGICFVASIVLLFLDLKALRPKCVPGIAFGFASALVLWVALALGSALDLQFGDRIYGSVAASDQSYRTAFTDGIARTSIAHPINPLYYADGPAPLRYHFFGFIAPAMVDKLGGETVSARQAFVASIAWCGIALGCLIAAFLRFFAPAETGTPAARSLIGISLLAVTGLDIIPNLILFFHHSFFLDMEWWNEAVTSWFGSLLWVPHHVGGLIAGLTGFLILWHAAKSEGLLRWVAAAIAGVALASMLGYSIYVGLVMALFLTVWTVITFFSGWRNHTGVLVAAGVVCIALALPYLKSLTGPAAGGSFLHFTVRRFQGAAVFGLQTEFAQHWKTGLARLALLPLNYLLELGFFLPVGILYIVRAWRLRARTPETIASIVMVLMSIGICTFLKSGVITNNDLGWRGFLPAQFMLLIWAVDFVPEEARMRLESQGGIVRGLAAPLPVLFLIGILSTVISIVGLRFSEVVYDRAPDYETGRTMYNARQVYERLRKILPASAIVQQNPDFENPVFNGLYSNRQTAVSDAGCGTAFGGSLDACRRVYPEVSALFRGSGASVEDVESVARQLKIDALIVTTRDPVWKASDSWMSKMHPAISTEHARAYLLNSNEQAGRGFQWSK